MTTSVIRSGTPGLEAFGSGSITVTIPSGTTAGALAILTLAGTTYFGNGSITTPSGWTVQSPFTEVSGSAPYYSSAVFTKVLTSGDITAGSVTVTVSTNYGLHPLSPNDTALQGHMYTVTFSRLVGSVGTVSNTDSGNLAADPSPPIAAEEFLLGVARSSPLSGITISGSAPAVAGWSSTINNPISATHPSAIVARHRSVSAGATDQPYYPATFDILTTLAVEINVGGGFRLGRNRFGTDNGGF